jgi:uncharacterized integral membrane protein
MYNRLLMVLVFVPLAIILVALAVANRGSAVFTLDPFNPGNPGLTVEMPLFVFLFAALLAGLIIGSAITWLRQGRYRKLARQRALEAQTLRDQTLRAPPHAAALPKPGA